MPPNEVCPHCGELVLDWHNEWYNAAQRTAIYKGQAAMDCPLCRQPVFWIQSRDITPSPKDSATPVFQRSVFVAAQWTPIREPDCANLTGYLEGHPAGQQYRDYWQSSEVQQADRQVVTP